MKQLKKWWSAYINLKFEKGIIDQCRSQMDEDNLLTGKHVSCLMMVLIAILLLFYIIFDTNLIRNIVCVAAIIIMLCIFIFSRGLLKNPKKITGFKTDLLIDFFSIICFSAGIYLGTFAIGDEMAVPAVWMFFFVILIFNRLPLRNLIVSLGAGIVFIICSYLTKRTFIFHYDVMHAVMSIAAAIVMSWMKSHMKVENVLALMRLQDANLEIMETVEEQQREVALLWHKARRDELTGLYKKNYFEEKVKSRLEESTVGEHHALVCIDLDNFKYINDSLGHMFGDDVLKQIAFFIRQEAGREDMACRFGGDEFCIFFPNIKSVAELENHLQHLLDHAKTACRIENSHLAVSLSAGAALYPQSGDSYKELFEQADKTLYQAKSNGKGQYRIHKSREIISSFSAV